MLRITQQTSVAAACSYYTNSDYYLGEGQELGGVWAGKGAARLGLAGGIQQRDWDGLCDNLDPTTGQQLTARKNGRRRIGWDFTFSVPKSVSVLHALSGDGRILDAFTAAVDQTMLDIESELLTRVRAGGQDADRVTANGVWGRFIHQTSRPVDGVPDPQLHAHAFLFNCTFDEVEGRWKAAQIADLKRNANYFNALMHGRLASALVALGIPIERTATSWRIAGIGDATAAKFACRTREINAAAARLGITDPVAKAELGALTRSRKNNKLSLHELRLLWQNRLTADEAAAQRAVQNRIGQPTRETDLDQPDPSNDIVACKALKRAADHHFERDSVVPERVLLTTAMHQALGQATPEEVLAAPRNTSLIVGEYQGQRMVTSREVLAEERRMVAFARDGRNSCEPLCASSAFETLSTDDGTGKPMNAGQRRALEQLCTSRDRVMVLRGVAGAGKTTLLTAAVANIEKAGKKVFAFAPSARASRGVLREEGFANAETVAFLLANADAQAALRDQVMLIDEAGLLGTRTMARLFELASERNARVILSGDRYQHKSVERGSALRLLEEEAGIRSAELTSIVRQKDQYRQAVAYLSQGRIEAGFTLLEKLKWVHEIEDPTCRYERIAAEYVQATEAGRSVIVVSPTHAEGRRVTAAIRATLQRERVVGTEERPVLKLTRRNLTAGQRQDLVNYVEGDVVVFTQNAKGYRKGTRLTVGTDAIPVDLAERFDVYQAGALLVAAGDLVRITANGVTADGHRVNNGQVFTVKAIDADGLMTLANGWQLGSGFGQLDLGYVSTSHASQGVTKDRVILAASSESFPATSREMLYVAASRGRTTCSIYTDARDELLEAARGTRDSTSAIELATWRQRLQRQRSVAMPAPPNMSPPYTRSREVAYER